MYNRPGENNIWLNVEKFLRDLLQPFNPIYKVTVIHLESFETLGQEDQYEII
jgi:hypothetical protein